MISIAAPFASLGEGGCWLNLSRPPSIVTPAQAGVHLIHRNAMPLSVFRWIPAFAGMTVSRM